MRALAPQMVCCLLELLRFLASVFSPFAFNKVGRASGPVLGTVLAHVPASVTIDFEAVQFSSTMVLSCSFFPEFEAESTRPRTPLTSSVSFSGARLHRVRLLAHAELCNR